MAGTTHRQFGSLRALPSGRWQGAYTGPDRRRHTAPSTFATKTAAATWLDGCRTAIVENRWTPDYGTTPIATADPTVLTFAEFAEQWLPGRVLKPSTRYRYRRMLDRRLLPAFGPRPIADITPAEVRIWHAGWGDRSPVMRASCYTLLAAIMRTAVGDRVAAHNPCTIPGARGVDKKHTTTVITVAQLGALADAMPARWRVLVHLTAFCALRWGEATELRRGDVDVAAGVIRVRRAVLRVDGEYIVGTPKTEAGIRDIAVPPHLRPMLAEHLLTVRDGSLLFPARSGGYLPRRTLMDHFTKATAAIGHPSLRWHDLRHVGATLAAQAGATLPELMQRLGHSSPRVAMIYQHAAAGRDQVIAARLSELAAR